MFTRTYPPQLSNTDATISDGGIRLSDDFIKRENLQEKKSVWLYVNKNKNRIGITFHPNNAPQSIKLTSSGNNTLSKMIWCSYLKVYTPIKLVMENKDIKNRRFPVKKVGGPSDKGEIVEYEIDLSAQPF